MQMTQLVRNIGRNDVKIIGRDSFLLMMFFYMLFMAVFLRFAVPALNTTLINKGVLPNNTIDAPLSGAYPMLVAYFGIYLGAALVGMLFGFMLLDERDDNTIKAMLVTPVSMNQYLLYRVGVPAVMAFFSVIAVVLILDLVQVALWQLMLIAAAASLAAPIAALFFATAAQNKVQGFAMSKFAGVAGWTILGGWFMPEPYQWLLGVFPPFWVAKAYWMVAAGENLWWLVLIVSVITQLGLIVLLARRFNTVAYQ